MIIGSFFRIFALIPVGVNNPDGDQGICLKNYRKNGK